MNSNSAKNLTATAIIIFGFVAIYGLSNYLVQKRPVLPDRYIDEDLSLQGEKLKGWSLGFEGLIADWYWIRSLQYIGDKLSKSNTKINLDDLKPLNPRLLYPLLDNATTLDPQFMSAYSYGAIVLPAIDPQHAIDIAEKGIRNNPDQWRLYQHLGYIYWRLKNYEKAAETYQRGSAIKTAPPFMKAMAAKMKSDGGSRETARQIYQQMLDEAQDSKARENAGLRLAELDSLNERDAIGKILKEFNQKTGRCAENWQEILPLLKNVKLPDGQVFRVDKNNDLVDPSDVPYLLDKQTCDVKLDVGKTKIPLN